MPLPVIRFASRMGAREPITLIITSLDLRINPPPWLTKLLLDHQTVCLFVLLFLSASSHSGPNPYRYFLTPPRLPLAHKCRCFLTLAALGISPLPKMLPFILYIFLKSFFLMFFYCGKNHII